MGASWMTGRIKKHREYWQMKSDGNGPLLKLFLRFALASYKDRDRADVVE
jgi:hypothetical protein